MKRFLLLFLPVFFLIGSCSSPGENKNDSAGNDSTALSQPGENILAEGEELLQKNCITCHTMQYIRMQPAFPRKNWKKITDKMIQNFGAPIADSTANKIVDYLVAVNGKKQ